VLRAAHALRQSTGVASGARIVLKKGIPVGAGLGGGSSDAAAALRLLSRLWRLQADKLDLVALASQLGSDVPLFLSAGAALLSGRGEQVRPLPALRGGYFVIVVPPWQEPHKTAAVYSAVTPADFGDGSHSRRIASQLANGAALEPRHLRNELEPAARRVFPALAEFQADLTARAGCRFVLTGAGPALFTFVPDRDDSLKLARASRAITPTVLVARPLVGLCTVGEVGSAGRIKTATPRSRRRPAGRPR
jgi:4-diphosphocytidyl-2-C-methyl-D-erythritol kinase